MEIKAIETCYNGYRFRSRLEARWAIVFDSLNVKYEYEPEGFDIGDGTKYLPDFYIHDYNMYAEVKPFREDRMNELEKCYKLCSKGENNKVIILFNIPVERKSSLWWYPCLYKEPFTKDVCIRPILLRKEGFCGADYFVSMQNDQLACGSVLNKRTWGKNGMINDYDFDYHYEIGDDFIKVTDCVEEEELFEINKAYSKARQARFEYGEGEILCRK